MVVVVVASSFFTFVDVLRVDVSASAVMDLLETSDAFLHESTFSLLVCTPPVWFAMAVVPVECGDTGKSWVCGLRL